MKEDKIIVSAQVSKEMKSGIEEYVDNNPEMNQSAVIRTGVRKVLSERPEITEDTQTNE